MLPKNNLGHDSNKSCRLSSSSLHDINHPPKPQLSFQKRLIFFFALRVGQRRIMRRSGSWWMIDSRGSGCSPHNHALTRESQTLMRARHECSVQFDSSKTKTVKGTVETRTSLLPNHAPASYYWEPVEKGHSNYLVPVRNELDWIFAFYLFHKRTDRLEGVAENNGMLWRKDPPMLLWLVSAVMSAFRFSPGLGQSLWWCDDEGRSYLWTHNSAYVSKFQVFT